MPHASPFDLSIGPAAVDDLPEIEALLSAHGLPVADVHEDIGRFVVARHADAIVATAGLEIRGRHGLLRSLCVAPDWRGSGLGATLCGLIEIHARRSGVEALWLLTTTAAAYFARQGFKPVARHDTAEEIRDTAEFTELCPSSAICMLKRLEGDPRLR